MLLLTYSPAIAVLLILTSLYLSKSRFIKFKHWRVLNCVLLKNAKFESFKIQNCRNFAEFRCREIYNLKIAKKTCHENFLVMSSLRGRRPKGKERGKTSVWSSREDRARSAWSVRDPPALILNISLPYYGLSRRLCNEFSKYWLGAEVWRNKLKEIIYSRFNVDVIFFCSRQLRFKF